MLYNGENPVLHIDDVAHLGWGGGIFEVAPRKYSALAFRISGNAVIESGGKKYFINTNDILYLPQNMGYTAEYTDTEMLVIHFVTARDDKEIELYTIQNSEKIYKMFLQAYSIWENKESGFKVYTMSALYNILGNIFEKESKAKLPPQFIKAISFINSNYRDNSLSIEMICKKSGIGATVFRRLFKEYYRKTPVEYITDLRLEYSRNLIAGGMPIESAAIESGFNDPKYFARVVKKRLGCTPRALKAYGK